MRILSYTLLMISLSLSAQEADPLFQSNDILPVTIEGPLETLIRDKSKEDYLPGLFRYEEPGGSTVEFDLKLRARGNFRHEKCDYPPVRLNFKKSQTKNTLFDKQDKLKLVVHCSRKAEYHQIVLQEYLAYRILNVLTDTSLRVRLLRATYSDTVDKWQSEPRYAFLIEHKDRAAKRLQLKELKVAGTSVAQIDPEYLNLTSVFQFFMGNTDFSPIAAAPGDDCCHNYVLFQNPGSLITAMPYDFDQSGFVDAPYANANPRFQLRSVRQRLYRGRCLNNDYVKGSIQTFRDKRAEIYALVEGQQGFSNDTRNDLINFMDQFYEIIENPGAIEKLILEKCI